MLFFICISYFECRNFHPCLLFFFSQPRNCLNRKCLPIPCILMWFCAIFYLKFRALGKTKEGSVSCISFIFARSLCQGFFVIVKADWQCHKKLNCSRFRISYCNVYHLSVLKCLCVSSFLMLYSNILHIQHVLLVVTLFLSWWPCNKLTSTDYLHISPAYFGFTCFKAC